jgi:hypothetical protein
MTLLFQFNSDQLARLAAICGQQHDLQLDQLQLGKVTLNALERANVTNLSGLAVLWAATPDRGHVLGTTAPKVLQSLGEALLLYTDSAGVIDWARHWAHRGLAAPISAPVPRNTKIVVPADLAHRLSNYTAALECGSALHLSARTINALNKSDLATVRQLVSAATVGIGKLPGLGAKSNTELREALAALPAALDAQGDLDHLAFARQREFPILPAQERPHGDEWLATMGPAVAKAAQATFEDPAEFEILARRYGMAGKPKMTLQAIADALSVTRQRIQQREARVISMLQAALLRDDYAEKPFCFAPWFCAPFRTTHRRLDDPVVRYWRESKLLTMIADSLQLAEDKVQPQLELFVDLLGWWRQQPNQRVEAIYGRRDDAAFPRAVEVVALIDQVLGDEPLGLDSYQLAGRINRHFPNFCSPETVHELVQLCSTCEVLADGRFRCRFSWLRSGADKAFLVLLEAGKPIHFEQIAEEISRRQLDRGREAALYGIKSHLLEDKRFEPVGRTGEWKLALWDHIDGRSIADIAHEILRVADRPLHADRIYDDISQRRPRVLRGSVPTLLSADDRFVRVAPATWALSVWDDARRSRFEAAARPSQPAEAEAIAAKFIAESPAGRLLREVVRHVATVDGRSEGSAYRVIGESPRFRFSEAPDQRGKIVHLAATTAE